MVCKECWDKASLLSASNHRSIYENYLEVLALHHEYGYRIDEHKEVIINEDETSKTE